jgi:hypothetical protein
VAILTCNDHSGLWCCAYSEPCCNNTFQNPPLGSLIFSDQVTTTVSASATATLATATAYSTVTTLPCDSESYANITIAVAVPLTVIACVLALYAFGLYRRLYHPVGQQKFTFSGEPSRGECDEANNAAHDYIPLHKIETGEVQEATGKSCDEGVQEATDKSSVGFKVLGFRKA